MCYSVLRNEPDLSKVDEHTMEWGQFNDAPRGWREITADEFANRTHSYSPERMEYRQIRDPDNRLAPVICAHLMFFWDMTGVGYASVYDTALRRWVAQFYAFGCAHSYRPLTRDELVAHGIRLGNCEHADICVKCGRVHQYDSSD